MERLVIDDRLNDLVDGIRHFLGRNVEVIGENREGHRLAMIGNSIGG